MVGAFGSIGITLTNTDWMHTTTKSKYVRYFTHFNPHYGFDTHLD